MHLLSQKNFEVEFTLARIRNDKANGLSCHVEKQDSKESCLVALNSKKIKAERVEKKHSSEEIQEEILD